ncbi:hypothetical protein EJ04DRAFT_575581 [Polyplosphaeria fusca]|uniref:G protein-coupled receptor GPR1 n=1 Tax=Polyplosphaeria fusca TaxID=682080 RepID=A0A9P4V4E1_9PLEO|nr:hypothetical protein EJ04DRAFT_575581 [Polyplosphaeria fusca]
MTASFVVFYWFCRMEKRFRHRLIMFLIFGDLMKATWLFLVAVYAIARGTVQTYSAFCQASGFLVQYGTETSDFAVLVIAIHSALQVFRPSMSARGHGLFPYRHLIYAGAMLVPALMASLAFVNPRWGYMSQGAFCTLPLRPLWYRLALTWIPRYLIAIIILGLAIAIYAHVGFEFRSFSKTGQGMKHSISTTTPMLSTLDTNEGTVPTRHPSSVLEGSALPNRRASSVMHEIVASRRSSLIRTMATIPGTLENHTRSHSLPPSPSSNKPCTFPLPSRPSIPQSKSIYPGPPTATLDSRNTSPLSSYPTTLAQRHLHAERHRIHRQLRLLFIYPLVYICMWLIPFVNHCMNYSDKWALHPLYWLSLANVICICLMGFVDCVVFGWREKPWRHVPGSSGEFWGSFVWWGDGEGRGSVGRMSGESEGQRVVTSLARARLEAEMEERRGNVRRGLEREKEDGR